MHSETAGGPPEFFGGYATQRAAEEHAEDIASQFVPASISVVPFPENVSEAANTVAIAVVERVLRWMQWRVYKSTRKHG